MVHISVSMLGQVPLSRIKFISSDTIDLSFQPIAMILRVLLTSKESRVIFNGTISILQRIWTGLSAESLSHHEGRASLDECSLWRWTPSLLATLPHLNDLLMLFLLVVALVHHVVWVVLEFSTDVLDVLGCHYLRQDFLVRWLLPPLLLTLLLRNVKIFLLEGGLVRLAVKVVMDDLLFSCQSCPEP